MSPRVDLCRQLAVRLLSRTSCPAASPALQAVELATAESSSPAAPAASAASRHFQDIPRPGRPAGYHLSDLARAGGPSHLHQLIHQRHAQLGGLFAEDMHGTEVVFVAESNHIREVFARDGECPQFLVPPAWTVFNQLHGCQRGLFFMSGLNWLHHRRIMNRYLLRPDPSCHEAAFNRVITKVLDRWQHQLNGHVTNAEDELYTFGVEILAAVLFGDSFGSVDGQNTTASDTKLFASVIRRIFTTSVQLSTMDAAAAAAEGASEWKQFEEAVRQGLSICRGYVEQKISDVEQRLRSGRPPVGLVAEIMANGEDLSKEAIVQIVADLFLAAGDTTAHSTQWALYRLGRDTDMQRRLLADIRSVAPPGADQLSAAQINRLPYVKAIVKETLRLYPVAPFLTRLIQQDTDIGGYTVPAGTPLCISLYTSGRDPRYFRDPLAFRPERWLRPGSSSSSSELTPASTTADRCPFHNSDISVHSAENRRHRHACMPFSSGVRSCIGKRVAELQMQLLLARLVHRYRLEVTTEQPATFLMRMVGVMSQELTLRITPRTPDE